MGGGISIMRPVAPLPGLFPPIQPKPKPLSWDQKIPASRLSTSGTTKDTSSSKMSPQSAEESFATFLETWHVLVCSYLCLSACLPACLRICVSLRQSVFVCL